MTTGKITISGLATPSQPVTITAYVPGLPGASGVSDHGALTGLADDDHPQYHTDARGDARYSALGHNHDGAYDPAGSASAAQSAAIAAAAAGLASHVGAADPHPQYLTATEGNAAYDASGAASAAQAFAIQRGNHTGTQAIATVTGLQTALDGKEAAGTAASAVTAHEAAGDPHPQYLTETEADALYAPIGGGGGTSDWIAHMSGDASAWLASHAVGPSGAATMSNGAIVANRLYLTPLVLPRGMNVTKLTVRVNAAGAAGTKARLGIYNAAADGSPGTRLIDAGEIATDVGSTYVTASVSVTLDPLKRYFLALVGNGTPALNGAASSAFGNAPLGFSLSGASPLPVGGVVASFIYAALPADCSGLSIGTGVAAHIPYIFVS